MSLIHQNSLPPSKYQYTTNILLSFICLIAINKLLWHEVNKLIPTAEIAPSQQQPQPQPQQSIHHLINHHHPTSNKILMKMMMNQSSQQQQQQHPHNITTTTTTTTAAGIQHSKCLCCPYGYHIDLDFVRYCESLENVIPSDGERLRRDKRRQRKSMEVMLGIEQLTSMELNHANNKLIQQNKNVYSPVHEELPTVEYDVYKTMMMVTPTSPPSPLKYQYLLPTRNTIQSSSSNEYISIEMDADGTGLFHHHKKQHPIHHHQHQHQYNDYQQYTNINHNNNHNNNNHHHHHNYRIPIDNLGPANLNSEESALFVKDILEDVCDDFERTLEKTKKRLYKWNQFDQRQEPKCITSSGQHQPQHHSFETYLPVTPFIDTRSIEIIDNVDNIDTAVDNNDEQQTDDNKIYNNNNNNGASAGAGTTSLQTIREQMAISLNRMRDLEEQVKIVPFLELEIKKLIEDKRNLQEEIHRKTKQVNERQVHNNNNTSTTTTTTPIPFTSQRINTTHLFNLNDKLMENSPSSGIGVPPPNNAIEPVPDQHNDPFIRQKQRCDVGMMTLPTMKRDIGIGTNQIRTKSIGLSPIGIISPSSVVVEQPMEQDDDDDIQRRRRLLFTQQDLDKSIINALHTYQHNQQMLRLQNSITVGTQMSNELFVEKIPDDKTELFSDAETLCKPETKSIGSSLDTITELNCDRCSEIHKHRRSIGINTNLPSQFEQQQQQNPTEPKLPISLKCLDLPPPKKPPPPPTKEDDEQTTRNQPPRIQIELSNQQEELLLNGQQQQQQRQRQDHYYQQQQYQQQNAQQLSIGVQCNVLLNRNNCSQTQRIKQMTLGTDTRDLIQFRDFTSQIELNETPAAGVAPAPGDIHQLTEILTPNTNVAKPPVPTTGPPPRQPQMPLLQLQNIELFATPPPPTPTITHDRHSNTDPILLLDRSMNTEINELPNIIDNETNTEPIDYLFNSKIIKINQCEIGIGTNTSYIHTINNDNIIDDLPLLGSAEEAAATADATEHIRIACSENYCDSCKDVIKNLANEFSSSISSTPPPPPSSSVVDEKMPSSIIVPPIIKTTNNFNNNNNNNTSRIPRPTSSSSSSRTNSPLTNRKFTRQNTYTIGTPPPPPTPSQSQSHSSVEQNNDDDLDNNNNFDDLIVPSITTTDECTDEIRLFTTALNSNNYNDYADDNDDETEMCPAELFLRHSTISTTDDVRELSISQNRLKNTNTELDAVIDDLIEIVPKEEPSIIIRTTSESPPSAAAATIISEPSQSSSQSTIISKLDVFPIKQNINNSDDNDDDDDNDEFANSKFITITPISLRSMLHKDESHENSNKLDRKINSMDDRSMDDDDDVAAAVAVAVADDIDQEEEEEEEEEGGDGRIEEVVINEPRIKRHPSKEMLAALKVINDSLQKQQQQQQQNHLKNANQLVQKEWFNISSTDNANPLAVEDYLDCFEEFSYQLLKYMVNLADFNGNTAMHYAVSHGNFDIVSILLDSKVCNVNQTNNAGYTCVMLVSLAKLKHSAHHTVVKRLFQLSDVNIRAKKHCQTALMLAVSHGNCDMVQMLLEAGADINIQDEDGSTALMCAAEHGRIDIVKLLLSQTDCDSSIQDVDGSTALKISLEAGYRDIGVLLYAHDHMSRNRSPYTSLRRNKKLAAAVAAASAASATINNTSIVGTSGSSSTTTGGGNKSTMLFQQKKSISTPSSPLPSTKFHHHNHNHPHSHSHQSPR